jgi:hypothetical protein
MNEGLHMRDPRERCSVSLIREHAVAPEAYGRFANLGLLAAVLILAALWLAFPPTQLSMTAPAENVVAQGTAMGDQSR